MRKLLFVVAILFIVPSIAKAACTGSNPNWSSTIDQASVQTCANNAASGSTITVASGTTSWSSSVTWSGKALKFAGQTTCTGGKTGTCTDNTDITVTASNANGFVANGCSTTNFCEITGFTLRESVVSGNGIIEVDGVAAAQNAFRIHHNHIVANSGPSRGIIPNNVFGLIDNNKFDGTAGGSIQFISVQGSGPGTDGGYTPWMIPNTLGTNNNVFIEDNSFTSNSPESVIDGYTGGHVVIRFNGFHNSNWGFHGTDSGNNRSLAYFEIYNNDFNNSGSSIRIGNIRGGTGVIFNNQILSGSYSGVALQLYRACPRDGSDTSGWGTLNGTNYAIGSTSFSAQASRQTHTTTGAPSSSNVLFCSLDRDTVCTADATCSGAGKGTCSGFFDGTGTNGYPGRDQPGIGHGQTLEPIYAWNNSFSLGADDGPGTCSPSNKVSATLVVLNRDFFTGSTVKPGYTSFTYPHPLQGSVGSGTFFVNNAISCSDTSGQPGTLAAPFCTITYGLTRLSGGNTLTVKAGTYNETPLITGPSGTSFQHTIIQGATGETVTIRGAGYGGGRVKISHGCSFIDFSNFTITFMNQGLYLDDDAGTSTACTNVTVSNIHITDIGQEGLAVRAGSSGSAPRNFLIQNSEIDHTGASGTNNGEGLYLGNASGTDTTNGVTVRGNTIHDTQDECIELKGDSHDNVIDGNILFNCLSPGSSFSNTGGAIEIDEPRNTSTNPNQIIKNNIIHDISLTGGITKRGIRAGTGATIFNNVLYNINSTYSCILSNTSNFPRLIYNNTVDCTTANAIVNSGTAVDMQNNIGPASSGSNLPVSSSFFLNYAGHDYRLAGGAPIGSGTNVVTTVPTDILGVTRTLPMDIGAYKFSGTVQPPTSPATALFSKLEKTQ